METLEALIFDLDGVIIDSEPIHEQTERTLFSRIGLGVPDFEYPGFKGVPDRDVIEYVNRKYGNGAFDVDQLIEVRQEIYHELAVHVQPLPGVIPFVRAASTRYRLAITTSSVPSNIFLPDELDGCFDVLVTASDVQRAKPDPQPYLLTVERLGLDAGNCLVIEDSIHGVHSAIRAGCLVAGLTTTFSAQQLKEAGAGIVADTFEVLAREIGLEMDGTDA